MGVVLLSVAAVIVTMLINVVGNYRMYHFIEIEDWATGFLKGLFLGLIIFIFLIVIGINCKTEPVETTKQNIYALKDNTEIHGSFSLGFGTVDDEQYYYYVTKDAQGFKKICKLKTSESVIKEENISQPYIQKREYRYKSSFARFMFGEYSGVVTYEFHVPKRTVTTQYKVDLQ
jgi:hypothetical protein